MREVLIVGDAVFHRFPIFDLFSASPRIFIKRDLEFVYQLRHIFASVFNNYFRLFLVKISKK